LPFRPLVDRADRPPNHSYSYLTIVISLVFIIRVPLGFRAAARLFVCLAPLLALGQPAFTTLRTWLLRIGLFLLQRPLPLLAHGWILIVDHTVQLGQRKCFVVVGLPASELPRAGYRLPQTAVTVLLVEVMAHANKSQVYLALQQAWQRVGTIVQVVSDHGADVLGGVRLLQADHPALIATYDVRHMLACLLKAELGSDPRWTSFLEKCGATLARLQQTAGNFLKPPKLRLKARYMSVEQHLRWAQQVLAWEATGAWEKLGALVDKSATQAEQWFEQQLGWLREYRHELSEYRLLMDIVELALKEVLGRGLSRQSAGRFWVLWQGQTSSLSLRVARFAEQVRAHVQAEGEKVPPGQTLLGSSDVIESLFGTFKERIKDHPGGELGSSVLLLPLLTQTISPETIQEAFQTVNMSDVNAWAQKNLGETPQTRKRKLFNSTETQDRAETPDNVPEEGPKVA